MSSAQAGCTSPSRSQSFRWRRTQIPNHRGGEIPWTSQVVVGRHRQGLTRAGSPKRIVGRPERKARPKCTLGPGLERQRAHRESTSPQVRAGFLQQRDALDMGVIGNRSKARRPRARSRARRRSRGHGPARPGRRRRRRPRGGPVHDLLDDGRLAPSRGGSRTTRSTGRRSPRRAPGRPPAHARVRRRPGCAPRGRRRAWRRPRRRSTRAGPDRVGQEGREEAHAGVQVERRLARLRASNVEHVVDQHLGGAGVDLPEAVRGDREVPRAHGTAYDGGSAGPRSGSRRSGTTSWERCSRIPSRPSRERDVALPGAPAQAVLVAGHRLDRRPRTSSPASRAAARAPRRP